MRKLLGEQARVLHRGCKILTFEFNFTLLSEYKMVLEYINEMNTVDVDDDYATPLGVNIVSNTVFFRFRPYWEDRVYKLEIWTDEFMMLPSDPTVKKAFANHIESMLSQGDIVK